MRAFRDRVLGSRVAVISAGIAGIGVIALAYLAGQGGPIQRGAGKGLPPEPSPTSAAVAPAVPGREPVAAAEEWFRAFRTVASTDPTTTAWADRVRPVVTGELAEQLRAVRGSDGGPAWTDFVARHCRSDTHDVGAVIPKEAPRAADSMFVQVSGEVVTTCATEPTDQAEPFAATVEVQRGADGLWRVAKRLY